MQFYSSNSCLASDVSFSLLTVQKSVTALIPVTVIIWNVNRNEPCVLIIRFIHLVIWQWILIWNDRRWQNEFFVKDEEVSLHDQDTNQDMFTLCARNSCVFTTYFSSSWELILELLYSIMQGMESILHYFEGPCSIFD